MTGPNPSAIKMTRLSLTIPACLGRDGDDSSSGGEWVVGWLEGVPPLGVVGWMEWDRRADGWLERVFGWLEGVPPLRVVGWMECDRQLDGWLIGMIYMT